MGANGGIWVGLEFDGSVSYTGEKWAIWVPTDNWPTDIALQGTTDPILARNESLVGEVDSDNWFVEGDTTTFDSGTFTFFRYQPVEEVDYRYYTNEYRWYNTEVVTVFKYYSSDASSWWLI